MGFGDFLIKPVQSASTAINEQSERIHQIKSDYEHYTKEELIERAKAYPPHGGIIAAILKERGYR